MADKRLPGDLANVPTAKEQGADIEWPIVRGFYVGPKVSDADYKAWSDTFKKMMATPAYDKLRAERGPVPFDLTGAEADAYIKQQVKGLPQAGRRLRPRGHEVGARPPSPPGRAVPFGAAPTTETSMSDRTLGAVCVVASAGMAWAASDYAAAISYEPVGPRAFPLLLAGLLAIAGCGWCCGRRCAARRLSRRAAEGHRPVRRGRAGLCAAVRAARLSRWPPR
jgi:hypothetical protein